MVVQLAALPAPALVVLAHVEPSPRHAPGGRSVPELCPGCRQINGIEQTSRAYLADLATEIARLRNGADHPRRPDHTIRSPRVGCRDRVPSRAEMSRSVTTSSRP